MVETLVLTHRRSGAECGMKDICHTSKQKAEKILYEKAEKIFTKWKFLKTETKKAKMFE